MLRIQADADRGMVDPGDLLRQLGRPDRVVVDRAAQDRLLRIVVLDGDGHTQFCRQISRLPQGGPLGRELVSHAVPGVAGATLASVADHHLSPDGVREPEAGVENVALKVVGGQVHQVDLQRGVDGVCQVSLKQLFPDHP